MLDIEDLKIPAGVRCLITTRKLVKSRPALAENFVMAWLESLRFILSQKKETKQIISKYTSNSDDVQLEEAWRSLTAQTEIPPYVSVSQLQGQVGMLAEDQPELSRFDAKSMVDNSVIKKLEDSGWIKKLFGSDKQLIGHGARLRRLGENAQINQRFRLQILGIRHGRNQRIDGVAQAVQRQRWKALQIFPRVEAVVLFDDRLVLQAQIARQNFFAQFRIVLNFFHARRQRADKPYDHWIGALSAWRGARPPHCR